MPLIALSQYKPITFSGYMEAYYAYDFNNPGNGLRPGFTYNYTRHDQINVNLALLKAAYSRKYTHANLELMSGTYPRYNLASEPAIFRKVYEANAGVKLSKRSNLWLDAGIFPSHIGFESAIGKDNSTLTRSILAENSPYYEAGTKLTYITANDKLLASALLLNGWQRIRRVDGNHSRAIGSQITYKPSAKITLNWSTFIGNDKADSVRKTRYFHNLYGIFKLGRQAGLIIGFDLGAEQKFSGSHDFNIWYSPVAVLNYKVSDKISLASRIEYYQDDKEVIISTQTSKGIKLWGFSTNIDYQLLRNLLVRIEAKNYSSKNPIFDHSLRLVSNNNAVTGSVAVSF